MKTTNPYLEAMRKAEEFQPFATHPQPLIFVVDSLTNATRQYRVELAPGGALRGAKCACKAGKYDCCVHRARARMLFEVWLETDQGLAWFAANMCAECKQLPAIEPNGMCLCCLANQEADKAMLSKPTPTEAELAKIRAELFD